MSRLDAHIVNYADDFVICCRGTADEAMTVMRGMMSKLKLTVNETKTRLCRLPEETFDFLGYTLGRNYDRRTGESYLGPRPSRKKVDRLCDEISELTERRTTWLDVEEQIGRINRKVTWLVQLFPHRDRQQGVPQHRQPRLATGCVSGCARSSRCGVRERTRFPDAYLHQELGLHRLQRT